MLDIFSEGYADQFGENEGKKVVKEYLLETAPT